MVFNKEKSFFLGKIAMKLLKKIVLICGVFAGIANAEGYTGETLVRTPKGHVKIQDLVKGDEVFSVYDKALEGGSCCAKCDKAEEKPKCGGDVRVKAKKIVGIAEKESTELYELRTGDDVLVLDADAKVFSLHDRKYLPVSELKAGDVTINVFFHPVLIDSINKLEGTQKTFVIEVEENHTFFAGKQNILVHNGPFMALLCGAACKVINALGCAGATAAGVPGGPAIVALIVAVCATMMEGSALSCAALCMSLPSP
jgi:hypothetical protein